MSNGSYFHWEKEEQTREEVETKWKLKEIPEIPEAAGRGI
jgi:hypothetical protein